MLPNVSFTMTEILDSPSPIKDTTKPAYLKKSIWLFRIYLIVFLSLTIFEYVKQTTTVFSAAAVNILNAAAALPALYLFIAPPLGLYCCYKSLKRLEEPAERRAKYILLHSFLCLMMIVLLFMMLS